MKSSNNKHMHKKYIFVYRRFYSAAVCSWQYVVWDSESNAEQDRQHMYNVTLRRFVGTIVAVEKQQVLHIVSTCL